MGIRGLLGSTKTIGTLEMKELRYEDIPDFMGLEEALAWSDQEFMPGR